MSWQSYMTQQHHDNILAAQCICGIHVIVQYRATIVDENNYLCVTIVLYYKSEGAYLRVFFYSLVPLIHDSILELG